MSKALEYLLSQPLLCTVEAAEIAASIVARDGDADLVAAKAGDRADGSRTMTVRDGVAVIPVKGAISRYATMMEGLCGGVNVASVARDLRSALDNPNVRAVMLDMDGPGGEANGIGELAGMIRAADAVKPVCAYIGGQACSAHAWLAMAAGEVVIHETASTGSIGAVGGVTVRSERPGTKTYKFISSQSPLKQADPSTDTGREAWQRRIDSLGELFVANAAKLRGVSVDHVLANFGRGDVMTGRAAVDAGMCDALGDFESTLARLSRGEKLPPKPEPANPSKKPGPAPAKSAKPKGTPMAFNFKSLFALAKTNPALADALAEAEDLTLSGAETALAGVLAGKAPAAAPARTEADIRAELKAQLEAEAKAEQAAAMTAFYGEQASAWFDGLVSAGKALPKDKALSVARYVDAALSDRLSGPLAYSEADGKNATATRLSALVATLEAAPANGRTSESIPGGHDALAAAKLAGLNALPNGRDDAAKAAEDAQVKALLEAAGVAAE